MELKQLTENIIGAALEAHRALGPGLLESTYEMCLAHELALRHLRFERQKPIPIQYKEIKLDCGYRADLLVENPSSSSSRLWKISRRCTMRSCSAT